MKSIIIAIFSLILLQAPAQTRPGSFAAIDKRVKTIDASSADTLAQKLTAPYKTEIEKVRAIFRWITEHIAYDIEGYHNPNGAYDGLWELSLQAGGGDIKANYHNRIVQKVLTEKKAICDGYSRLFKTLCDHAKIKCEIIPGYIRWSSDPIGEMTNRLHAWNAVYINNSWKLIDATWASGYSNSEVIAFTKSYNEFFFCTNPVELFNDHFPSDSKWSLLPNTPSLQQFYNFPFYFPAFYQSKISAVNLTKGTIFVNRKDKLIQLQLETREKVNDLLIYDWPAKPGRIDSSRKDDEITEEVADLNSPLYTVENNQITYLYKVQSEQATKLDVILNGKIILRYAIKFK